MTRTKTKLQQIGQALRSHALSYPETNEEFPWGHTAVKVRGKAFLFMGDGPEELSFSVKLPQSKEVALMLPFAEPTGYGLGKSGWVSASFASGDDPPLDMLVAWIDESYRAIAPKRLIARLDDLSEGTAAPVRATRKTAKKVAKKIAGKRGSR